MYCKTICLWGLAEAAGSRGSRLTAGFFVGKRREKILREFTWLQTKKRKNLLVLLEKRI